MRDDDDDERTVKIELLSRWKLEAEFRKNTQMMRFAKEEKSKFIDGNY